MRLQQKEHESTRRRNKDEITQEYLHTMRLQEEEHKSMRRRDKEYITQD
jgi:hypothetical protein